jgi:hypothetical protein
MKMKPHGIALMIGIGTPNQLGREGHGDDGHDDIATEAILGIAQSMHRGGPSTVRDMRAFIDALERMCATYMDKDRSGFEDASSDACEALRALMDD